MFRITKQADYGVVLMTYFSLHGDRGVQNARDLAEKARLPQPTATKILKVLAREGLLKSQRGVKGGYSLSRPATEITVAEIIVALEGPIAITQCCEHGAGCVQEEHCPVHGNWKLIDRVVRDALSGITLAELSQPTRTLAEVAGAPLVGELAAMQESST